MDPILAHLLDFNKTESIEYKGRYLIPPKGLQEMLDNFKRFHLNVKEEVQPEISLEPESEPEPEPEPDNTLEELYKALD